MSEKKRVIVIGAGASGLMAAITAVRSGAKVTVLEHMNFIAKKIEHTGNGRCNFTNRNQDISFYNGTSRQFIKEILEKFSFEDTLDFFEEIGLVYREKDGYFYPVSNQATAVSDILRMEAEHLKIKIACNIEIEKIQQINGEFKIKTKGYEYKCDSLIIATGSKADPVTGSDGSGYKLVEKMGHSIVRPCPALVALHSSGKEINTLAGLRNFGAATLYIDGEKVSTEVGEIQFIKNGISGIPVFQLSRYASIVLNSSGYNNKADKNKMHEIKLKIDFLPMYSEKQLQKLLSKRLEYNSYKNLKGFLKGLLHEKIITVISDKLSILGNIKVSEFTEDQWKNTCSVIKNLEFEISGTGDFNSAQVCAGGVPTEELNENLESKLIKNLYFAGEIINVDGKCGGYNLQWAWSSGHVAGEAAAL